MMICPDCGIDKPKGAFTHPLHTNTVMKKCRSCIVVDGRKTRKIKEIVKNTNNATETVGKIVVNILKEAGEPVAIDSLIQQVMALNLGNRLTGVSPAVSKHYAEAIGEWKHVDRLKQDGQYYYFYDPKVNRGAIVDPIVVPMTLDLTPDPIAEPVVETAIVVPVVNNNGFEIVAEAKSGGYVLKYEGKLFIAKEMDL